MSATVFKLSAGGQTIVEVLENALSLARLGHLEAVLVVGCSQIGHGWDGATVDDMAWPLARIAAALEDSRFAMFTLGVDGLTDMNRPGQDEDGD